MSTGTAGAYGAMFGGALGAIEGLVLARPLANIFGGFDGNQGPSRTPA